MKKILILFTVLFAANSFAQTYSVSPANTVTTNVQLNTFTIIPIKQINTGSSSIILKWDYVSDNMNVSWDLSICDFAHCYPGLPLSGTMDTVPVGGKGFIDLNIDPFNFSGSGYVKYYVYQDGFYANGDTLTFIVNVGSSAINEASFRNNFEFYPNPASDKLIFKSNNLINEVTEIEIFNTIGQKVYSSTLEEIEAKIDVSALANGLYFVQFSDDKTNILQTKKLIIEHK